MCKIQKLILGEQLGCLHKDKIVMEITPSIADTIANTFEKLALEERYSYEKQGIYREICDCFRKAFREWNKKRLEKDKREINKKKK